MNYLLGWISSVWLPAFAALPMPALAVSLIAAALGLFAVVSYLRKRPMPTWLPTALVAAVTAQVAILVFLEPLDLRPSADLMRGLAAGLVGLIAWLSISFIAHQGAVFDQAKGFAIVTCEGASRLQAEAPKAFLDAAGIRTSRPVLLTVFDGDKPVHTRRLRIKYRRGENERAEPRLHLNPKDLADLGLSPSETPVDRAWIYLRNSPTWTFEHFWNYPDLAIRVSNRLAAFTVFTPLIASGVMQQSFAG